MRAWAMAAVVVWAVGCGGSSGGGEDELPCTAAAEAIRGDVHCISCRECLGTTVGQSTRCYIMAADGGPTRTCYEVAESCLEGGSVHACHPSVDICKRYESECR
jgi:hypothetical protein